MTDVFTSDQSSHPRCQGLNELLCRLAAHNREADWAELIAVHGSYIRSACKRHLSSEEWLDDAVQETLLCLHRSLPQRAPGSDGEASAWLRTVAANCATNLHNSETARHRRERVVAEEVTVVEDKETTLEEQKARLLEALSSLSPVQWEILRLRFLEGMSAEEIGQRLGISAANAQRMGHRALVRLRERLTPDREKVSQSQAAMGLMLLLSCPEVFSQAPALASGAGALASSSAAASGASPVIVSAAAAKTGISLLTLGGIGVAGVALATGAFFMFHGQQKTPILNPPPKEISRTIHPVVQEKVAVGERISSATTPVQVSFKVTERVDSKATFSLGGLIEDNTAAKGGVVVYLLSKGEVVSATTTDAEGHFLFDGLNGTPMDYSVRIDGSQ